MAACTKCGSVVSEGAAFCGVCGTPVSSPASPVTQGPVASTSAGLSSNVAAALSYLLGLITGILFLVMEPYKRDSYVRFHAFQSICYSIIVMVFWIVWNQIWLGLFSMGFLFTMFSLVGNLISLGIFAFWLFLMYKAYNNERYLIPVIGEFAAKQAGK